MGLQERTRVYVRKSCLWIGDKAGEFPFVPAIILSVLGISADFDARPRVESTG
jgi:hypothetical protein